MRSPLKVLAVAAAVLVGLATPALAHVTIQPPSAAKGGYTAFAFRVPNESDTAATTELEVQLPAELESARTKPVPGWNVAVDGKTITWSGGRIEPGQFQEFEISVGPLPEDVDQLVFPAVQTYDDGEVTSWIQTEEDAEHPAPTLTLTEASGEDDHHAAADDEDETATSELATPSEDDDGGDTNVAPAYGLAVAALALAIVALVRSGRKSA